MKHNGEQNGNISSEFSFIIWHVACIYPNTIMFSLFCRMLSSLTMSYRMYDREWEDEKRQRAEQKRRHRK